ncbi:MAG: hypothetical protein Q9M92_10530 [Enterobacterales bacterium]|nr:hypothetical protein [Enterobacterales bacterium]
MNTYEIIQNMIRLIPLAVLLPLFIYLLHLKWFARFGVMFVVGWLIVAISTLIFWKYSIDYAPNEEVLSRLTEKDGAPKLFGTLFGGVFGLMYFVVFEIVRVLYVIIQSAISWVKLRNA